ncbi:hypothetical protein, partial [Stenotrophomonas maltophilia]|uniref:hypothetical protein n=1 Tax=Stenotrophomonas maltophilia TaxID=40324 RepID=UPI0019543970
HRDVQEHVQARLVALVAGAPLGLSDAHVIVEVNLDSAAWAVTLRVLAASGRRHRVDVSALGEGLHPVQRSSIRPPAASGRC